MLVGILFSFISFSYFYRASKKHREIGKREIMHYYQQLKMIQILCRLTKQKKFCD